MEIIYKELMITKIRQKVKEALKQGKIIEKIILSEDEFNDFVDELNKIELANSIFTIGSTVKYFKFDSITIECKPSLWR
jgi:hypothetical protein